MRLALLVVTCLFLGSCRKPQKDFVSEAGRFSARFPDQPTEEVKTALASGLQLEVHLFSSNRGADGFMAVVYNDYPPEILTAKPASTILDESRDGMLRATGFTLVTETVEKLGSCQGREVLGEAAGGKARVRQRFFLCGRRLYQIMWVGPPSVQFERGVGEFLESLQVVDSP